MSKVEENFLGKVSKRIKTSIFDDEPDKTSDSLVIERLQSFASAESPRQRIKAVNRKADMDNSGNTQAPPVADLTTPPHSVDAEHRLVEFAIEPAVPFDGDQHAPPNDRLPASEDLEPLQACKPLATILLVEDEIVTQRLIRNILEERGYEVIVAEDGVDALMALGKIKFDLVICDINMPNMDGFTLMEFMNKKNILIPVIFNTILEDVEAEIRGLALGAKDYIRKPINRDLLLLRVRKALDK